MGKKGRSITLKLMVRAEGAAEETSKFLGHGVCDNISKSSQLMTGTDSAELILREVVSLAKAIGRDSDQWRGVGVSIARLEDKGESNQSMLRFLTKGKKEDERKENLPREKETTELKSNNPGETVKAENPGEETGCVTHLEVEDEKKPDPTFLAALPPDLRAEVEAQFRQKRREARSASDIARKQEQCLEMVQPTPNEDVVEKRKGSSSFSLEVEEASGSKSKELRPRKASPISTQLDPQFMAEMPADIREELEEHQRERERMKVEDKRMKVKEAEALSPAEVSFSQLDPEVLV